MASQAIALTYSSPAHAYGRRSRSLCLRLHSQNDLDNLRLFPSRVKSRRYLTLFRVVSKLQASFAGRLPEFAELQSAEVVTVVIEDVKS